MEHLLGGIKLTDLIEVCGKSSVKRLKCGDLEIEFSGPSLVVQDPIQLLDPSSLIGPAVELKPPEISQEMQRQIDEIHRIEFIENLKLTSPLLYEEMLARGEIEDVQDEQDDRGAE